MMMKDRWIEGLSQWVRLAFLLLACMVAVRPLFFLEVYCRVGLEPVHFFTILSGSLFDLLLVARIFAIGLLPFLLAYLFKPQLARGIFLALMVLYFVAAALLAEYYCNLLSPLDHVILVYSFDDLKTTVSASSSFSLTPVLWFLLQMAVPVLLMRCLVDYLDDESRMKSVMDADLADEQLKKAISAYQRLHPEFDYDHPHYPFFRKTTDADVLGPFFHRTTDGLPPNLVFVMVEGLGRCLTGVSDPQLSFTPFLDSLASEGLFWRNCLSTAERTFGVIPSVFASAPHGRYGFSTSLAPTPRHHSLLKDLKRNGYHLSFYYGGNPQFDHYDGFLKSNLVDDVFTSQKATTDTVRDRLLMENHRWGLDDDQLMKEVVRQKKADTLMRRPFADLFLTLSTHEPFVIDNLSEYEEKVKRMVEQAGPLSDKEYANVMNNSNRDVVDYFSGQDFVSNKNLLRLDGLLCETLLHDPQRLDSLKSERDQFDMVSRYVVQNDLLLPHDAGVQLYQCRLDFEDNTLGVFDPYLVRSEGMLRVDKKTAYFYLCSPVMIRPVFKELIVELSFDIKITDTLQPIPILVANCGESYVRQPLLSPSSKPLDSGEWEHFHTGFVINAFDKTEVEQLKIYLWNKEQSSFLMDNLMIDINAIFLQ